MKNRIAVNIAGQEFTLVATEDEAYVQKVSHNVDVQMRQLLTENKVSFVNAAVLTAVNISDAYFKEVESAENLRHQLKEYLEDSARVKLELAEAKREIFRLQSKK